MANHRVTTEKDFKKYKLILKETWHIIKYQLKKRNGKTKNKKQNKEQQQQ